MTDEPGTERREPPPPGTLRIGQIAGVDVVVRTSWIFVAVLIAVLVAPRVDEVAPGLGALKYVAGLAFAVLLYLAVLLHEASHAIAAVHYGIPVKTISITFLGGMTEMGEEAKTAWQEFVIAVVGPLTSLLVGGAALGLTFVAPDGLLLLAVQSLAVANLGIGILNLVPGLPLDGGRVLRAAVWGARNDRDSGTVASAWGGRLAAAGILAWPFVVAAVQDRRPDITSVFLSAFVAMFVWGGANAALTHVRLRRRLPALQARPLARRVIVVPEGLAVSEAVRRAQEAGAGGIATQASDDRVVGLVDERALLAVPDERRAWVPVSSVARHLDAGLTLPADLVGEELVRAMTATPASEYLLVEGDGRPYGILVTADVDAAFAAGA